MKRIRPTFLPAVPPIYERLHRGRQGEGRVAQGHRHRDLGGHAAVGVASSSRGRRDRAASWSRATGSSETSPVLMANPVGPSRVAGTVGPADAEHRGARRRPRQPHRRPQPRRARRAHRARPAGVLRLLEEAGRDGGGVRARSDDGALVPHRRHRHDRRQRLRPHRRPHQGTHHHGRLQRGAERGRRQPARASGCRRMSPSSACRASTAARMSPPPSCSSRASRSTRTSIRDYARDNLAAYKVPRRIVAVDDLPRSLIGKVLRKQVQRRPRSRSSRPSNGPPTVVQAVRRATGLHRTQLFRRRPIACTTRGDRWVARLVG